MDRKERLLPIPLTGENVDFASQWDRMGQCTLVDNADTEGRGFGRGSKGALLSLCSCCVAEEEAEFWQEIKPSILTAIKGGGLPHEK
jgi:hypothetical protein